jgi:broad specificity phosphatase PhoE
VTDAFTGIASTSSVRAVELVLVQHAEKESLPGDPGLTTTGRLQAAALATLLAESAWDLLATSPLRRALETAEIIGKACGLPLTVDERFRERINFGDAPFEQSLDEFLADWTHATGDRSWTPAAGDSSNLTAARFEEAIDEIVAKGPHRALIVTHGGATVDLLRTLFGDKHIRRLAPTAIDDGIASCGLTVISRDADWHLVQIGAAVLPRHRASHWSSREP